MQNISVIKEGKVLNGVVRDEGLCPIHSVNRTVLYETKISAYKFDGLGGAIIEMESQTDQNLSDDERSKADRAFLADHGFQVI